MKDLNEMDIQDSDGRIVISPGLKVRHKDSQYEYTVDTVTTDAAGKNVVVLNLPEEPRVQPQHSSDDVLSDLTKHEVIYEVDPNVVLYEPDEVNLPDDDSNDEYLAVPQEEFEKDYEVK